MVPLSAVEPLARRRVGAAIHRARVDAQVSASELAAACGVSTETVLAWERGSHGVRFSRLWQIHIALDVPIDHLTGG